MSKKDRKGSCNNVKQNNKEQNDIRKQSATQQKGNRGGKIPENRGSGTGKNPAQTSNSKYEQFDNNNQ